ncbi:MAG: proton-conducting transporter membrane subunit [Planctomycetota bacterium]
MTILLPALGVMILGGLAALAARRSGRTATAFGAGSAVAGGILGLAPAVSAALGAPVETLRLPWGMPGGEFHVALDALSGFFLVPTLLLTALAAIYGAAYLAPHREGKSLGSSWFCFNLLTASMALVLTARNGILFLVAWEVMALASFFLVTFEHEKPGVRRAGWTYLVATHLGTAVLLVMFVIMADAAGSFDFDAWTGVAGRTAMSAGGLFVLAIIGFGTKAGFMPLHVWLPEAHPAAPSHVSAVMSGVMIKTGIYGILRALAFLGPPPMWWGWTLVGIGVTSGVLGVLFALAQHDLKRLLAYHSVENIGIIALGLGLGLVGVSAGMPALAVLGFAGGLLHVLNHALFKGLLFLGAGSVLHATGTRDMDHLGGLMKRMPWTGMTFLVGAAAIAGLPPLNGFVSEFLIYLGAYRSAVGGSAPAALVPGILVIGGLALIGGLAAACFTKAFGIVFLGEPRSDPAVHARECPLAMKLPMLTLAAGCVLVGLFPAPVVNALLPVITSLVGEPAPRVAAALNLANGPLVMITGIAFLFLALTAGLILFRRWLLSDRPVENSVTWDCGYARPTARMQYTASSYAQPFTALFRMFLRTRRRAVPPEGFFPKRASLATHTPDVSREGLFRPVFAATEDALGRLRGLQHGRIQSYVLYIVITLLALLAWKME